jgi:hypothetical protein
MCLAPPAWYTATDVQRRAAGNAGGYVLHTVISNFSKEESWVH